VTLLVAGAPTPGYRNPNLLTYSEQFDNAAWTKTGTASVTANAGAGPDGRTIADTLNLPATGDRLHQSITAKGSTTYTGSVWLSGSGTLNVTLSSSGGTFVTTTLPITLTATLTRYDVSITTNSDNTGLFLIVGRYSGFGNTGTATSALAASAQLVEGSDPLGYRSVEATRQAYGYGWSTELRTTQDATGGRDVTILPVNELTYSADPQSTAEAGETRPWIDSDTSVSLNAATGPDGRNNLTKFIADATTTFHVRSQTITGLAPSQEMTVGVYIGNVQVNTGQPVGMIESAPPVQPPSSGVAVLLLRSTTRRRLLPPSPASSSASGRTGKS
jgi:hypothetical protein